jgi:putative AlgH/UPF0301 family transcriptional regulator
MGQQQGEVVVAWAASLGCAEWEAAQMGNCQEVVEGRWVMVKG